MATLRCLDGMQLGAVLSPRPELRAHTCVRIHHGH
jgi:hypothetical protein